MNKLKKILILPLAAASLGLATLGATAQPAEAGSDCTLYRVWQGWKGGCRWGKTALKIECVDGNRSYVIYSSIRETRDHVLRCNIFYSPRRARILHY